MEKGLLFNLREKLLLSFLLIGFSLFNTIDVKAACPGSYNSLTFGTYTGLGDMDIEIGGVLVDHDTIIVTGNANISGDTLNLDICNTFSPVNGTTVTFWNTGGTLTGTFFDVIITGNGSNLSNWTVRYNYPLPGDISAYYCGVSVAIAPITGLELCVGTQFGFIANKTPGSTVVTDYTWTTDNLSSVFSSNNSPAASSINFTPGTPTPFASADTLIVAMTTDQGCVVYDTVEINVNPDILVDVTLNPSGAVPSEMCENGTLDLKGSGSGGNSSLNYSWDVYVNNIAGFAANFFTNPVSLNNNTGMTTTMFSIPPGTISGITTIEIVLNVDDATTCESADTVTITVVPEPDIALVTPPTSPVCSGIADNVNFTVSNPNGNGDTFYWVANYNGASGNSPGCTSGTSILDTVTNTTMAPIIVEYTVWASTTINGADCGGGCLSSTPLTVFVTINPEPVVLNQSATICSDAIVGLTLNGDSDGAPVVTSYNIVSIENLGGLTPGGSNATPGAGQASSAIANDTWTNTTSGSEDITYFIVPTDGTCLGDTFTVTVTVNPEPVGVNDTDATCSGVALAYDLQNNVDVLGNAVNSTFSWVATPNPNVTGESTVAVLTGTINDVLINTTGSPEDVIYTVTPTSTPEGCVGSSFTVTVTVNPEPVGDDDVAETCSNVALNYSLQNNVNTLGNGVVSNFSWVAADNTNVTGESLAPVVSDNITDNLINLTGADETVIYTVTPTSDPSGCVGAPFMVTVTVHPEPVGVNDTEVTCSDVALTYDLQNNVNTLGNGVASTFSWVAADNVNVTGESLAPVSSGTITDILTNVSSNPEIVAYTVTPTSTTEGCVGAPFTILVTVNPEPVVANQTATVCSDETFSFLLNDDVDGPSATTYNITNINMGGLTPSGASSAQAYNAVDMAGLQNYGQRLGMEFTVTAPVTISQLGAFDSNQDGLLSPITVGIIRSDNTTMAGPVTLSGVVDPLGADGKHRMQNIAPVVLVPGFTYTIVAVGYSALELNGNINSGSSPVSTNTVGGLITFGSSPYGGFGFGLPTTPYAPSAVFHAGTFSISTPITTGNGFSSSALYTHAYTNTTPAPVDVVYDVVPVSALGCEGNPFTVTVTVNPEPVVADQTATVCSDVAIGVTLGNDPDGPSAVTYDIPSINNGGLTASAGTPATGTGFANSEIANDAWTNTTTAPVNVVYTVIPYSADGCVGDTFTVTVTINPEPVVANQTATVCSDVAIGVTLGDDPDGPAAVTYNITNINSNGLLASAGSPATGSGFANSVIADDAWTNTTPANVDVVYTVVPVSFDGCEGNPFTVTVTINPEPVVANQTATICSDEASGVVLGDDVDSPAVASYSITLINSNGLVASAGTPVTGTGFGNMEIVDDAWTNTTNANVDVVYTVVPVSALGCAGDPFTVTLTINPEPVVDDQTKTVCSDEPTGLTLGNDVDGPAAVTYNITSIVIDPNLTISAGTPVTGTGFLNSEIADDAYNNVTDAPHTVVYTVVPVSALGCEGDPFTVTITVNPEPVVANQNLGFICSDIEFGVNYNGDPGISPLTYNLISINNPGALTPRDSVEIPGTIGMTADDLADDAWTNITNADAVITYTVEPVSPDGCVGTPFTVTVTIRPEPVVNDIVTDPACSRVNIGASSTLPASGVNVGVGTYRWANLSIPAPLAATGSAESVLAVGLAGINSSNTANYPFNLTNSGIFAGGRRAIINNDDFSNYTSNSADVIYSIIPIGAAPGNCVGDTFTVTATINPEPVGAPATETTCSGVTFSYDLNEYLTNLGNYPDDTDDDLEDVTFAWEITAMSPLPFAVGAAIGDVGSGQFLTDNVTNIVNFPLTVTYEVTPTSYLGCTGNPFLVNVVVNNNPDATMNPNGDLTLCQGEERTLLGFVLPAGPYTYSWTITSASPGNASLLNANSLSPVLTAQTDNTNNITVQFKVTDTTTGCSDSVNTTFTILPLPTFAAGEPLDLQACASVLNGLQGTFNLNNSVPTTVGTITFHVSESDAVAGIGAIPNTTTYNGTNGQEVWVRLTGANGCYTIESIILTVNPLPTVTISGDLDNCAGESTTLTAAGGGTYAWSSGDLVAATTVSPALTTLYTVTVTSAAGCTNTASVTVVVHPLPTATISATDNLICVGESTTLTAGGGSSYLWSTGAVTAAITVSPATTTMYIVTVTDVYGCTNTAAMTINVSPAMAWASVTSTPTSCFGGSNGAVSATATGGTPAITYAWEDGDGNPVGTTNLEAGTYHVTATDAAGCTIDTIIMVTEPSELTISGLIITDVLCNGGNDGVAYGIVSGGTPKVAGYIITVQGSGLPVTVTDFGFNFSNLVADGYELTVEDSLGCTITTTFTINEPTAILVTATATDAPCFGGNGEITGNASGGTPGYTYFIDYPNDGQPSPVFSAAAGTYTLVVEDENSCTASTSVTVGEATALSLTTSQTNETCVGQEDGSITVNVSGGTPGFTYEWSDGQTTATASGLAAGTYTVTVTDNNGCTASASATLTNNPLPTFATGEPLDLEACATVLNGLQGIFDLTDAIVSTTGTITYHVSQSDAESGIGAIGNTTSYAGNNGQEVWVRLVDGNGCYAVGNLILTVNPLPVASISGDLEICNGESTTLTAAGGISYVWSTGAITTSVLVSPIVTTNYTVTATDANGCTNTATVTVVVNQLPVATISATDMVICLGQSTTLTASGGSTYLWSTGAVTASITVSPVVNTTYMVTVTDIVGCQSSASKLISISPAMTWDVATATDASCFGGNDGSVSATVLGGTAPVTYAWEDGDGNPSGTTGLAAGTYHVTATDDEGCSIDTLLVVGQPTQIEITGLLLTNVLCNGDSTGTAFATIIGGTPALTGYTITIQGSGAPLVQNDFGFYFDQLPADGYEITVEDDNGCTISTVINITEPTPLVVTGTTDDALCAGGLGTITAFASGGTTGYLFFIDFPNGGQASPVFSAAAGTYTLVVEDAHSCRDSVEVIVGEPVALALSTSTTNESCDDANDGTATVTVGGGTPGFTYVWSDGQTTAIATGLGAGTYTVTVTDNNGCSSSASATVALTGPGAPAVVNCPSDLTLYVVDCDLSYSWVAPTITDNCDVIELVVDLDGATNEGYANGVQQANFGPGTYNIVYTHAGPDTIACEFTVTVIDTIDPIIVCPLTVQVACIEDVPQAHGNFVDFINDGGILNDNCTVNLSTLFHVGDTGLSAPECINRDTITRVYSIFDIYGNSNTCSQTIIVHDDIDPLFISFAPDTLINCDADSTVAALGAPVAEDNCLSGVTYAHSNVSTQGSDPTDCDFYNYVVTRTWVATDACGNSTAVDQIIAVQDTTDPTAACVNISIDLDPFGNVTITPADVNGSSDDNCMPANLLNLSASPLSFTCNEVGANDVVLTVTDACGNASTCIAVVTVVDTEPPVAICNAAINVYLDVNGLATIDTTDINNGSWDNCAVDTMTLSVYNFDCTDVGAPISVELTVYDVYGNSASCFTLVTVLDTIDPVAVCQNINLYLDATGNATVDPQDLDGGSTDACGGLTFSANPDDFTCANVGANTVVLTVTDVNNNSSTCTAIVMVLDTIDPVAVCQNINLYLDATGNAEVDAEDLDGGSSDACGGLTFSANPEDFTCANVGTNAVILTVTDVNLNTATCTAIVMVIDTIDPVAVCQNVSVYLDVTGNGSTTAALVNNGSSDACGIDTMYLDIYNFTCSDVSEVNTVVLTVVDVNGNSATCSAIVTVLDTIDPVAVCQNINLYLDANGDATVDPADLDGGSTDACAGFTYSANPANFDCTDVGPNTVVLTVTDVNNNSSTCLAIVTVLDTIDPVAICQNVTVYLDVTGNGSTTAALVNNGSNDACGIDTMYLDIYNFTCSDVSEVNTVVLTVVDVNGNSATCSANVSVLDTIDPVAICMDTTIYLDANGLASVTAPQLDGGSTDACGGLTFAASQTSFDCGDIGANNITVTVTDVNNNSSTCVAVVTVLDTLNPVFSQCPGNAILGSDPNGCYQTYQIVLDTIFDNCTAPSAISVQVKGRVVANNGTIPMTISPLGAGGYTVTATFGLPVGNNRVTVIATDGQGNVDSCVWYVQVNDIWAPIITNCPNDITVNVNPATCVGQGFWPEPNVSDNCSGVGMTTQNNNQYFPGYNFPLGVTQVVYTATDASGNTTTCAFNVNVVGTCTPPAPDLSPEHTLGSTSYSPGQTKSIVVRVRNLSSNPTTAPVTFYVQKMDPNFTVTVNPTATSVTVGVNVFAVTNDDWVITEQATRWRFVSKPGVVIGGNATNFVGVQLTASGLQGSTSSLTTSIVAGTGGGETPTNNNMKISSLSIN